MIRFLDLIHEYQLLRATRQLQVPLDAAEEARLVALAHMLRGERPHDPGERREMPRLRCPLRAGFTLASKFGSGQVRDISGGGVAIATPTPAQLGDEVLVHIPDAVAETEHIFPARVVWRREGAEGAMGLAFEGIPTETVPTLRGRPRRRRRYTPMVA